ncbi:MAG: SoxR reducing system RseC family protein [Candidatus Omnitrophota bacterium]
MKEKGVIVKQDEKNTTIEIRPAEACSKCCSCGAGNIRKIVVKNEQIQELTVGNSVEVEIDDKIMQKIYILLYGVPLAIFVLTIVFCHWIVGSPIISFLCAFITTILCYIAVGRYLRASCGSILGVKVKPLVSGENNRDVSHL